MWNFNFKKWNKTEKKYDNLTPYQCGCLDIKILNYILRIVGNNVASDCHVYFRSSTGGIAIAQHFISTFYTMYYYWDKIKVTVCNHLHFGH